MFVVTLTYTADLAEIDAALDDHVEWLGRQYADGVLVASGRRAPRVGGVLLAVGVSRGDLDRRLATDPFHRRGLAEYDVVEFVASRVADGLERLQS
ncbi:MAG: YciI family protein [Actinocatenispora sp.]